MCDDFKLFITNLDHENMGIAGVLGGGGGNYLPPRLKIPHPQASTCPPSHQSPKK